MKDFFRYKSPVRYTDCVLIYRHVYAKTRPERKRRDHDNIEINMVSDIIALYVMEDDAPSFCRHYYCSAAAMEERTEVYVVPNEDFPLWLKIEKSMPEEGIPLYSDTPWDLQKICKNRRTNGDEKHMDYQTEKTLKNQGESTDGRGVDSDKESSPVVGGSDGSGT